MTERNKVVKIQCPHCGWTRTLSLAIGEASLTDVVRGTTDDLKKVAARMKAALADPKIDAANEWLDMPQCPNCGNIFRYNLRTRDVKK